MRGSVLSTKGRITIPAELRQKLGIKPGTRLYWSQENVRLVITVGDSERPFTPHDPAFEKKMAKARRS
jgi:AbrB family looped-hinge helix DNA binding protein